MSTRRSRLLMAGALVPLVAGSAFWTANIAGVGGPDSTSATPPATSDAPAALPDGTSLPSAEVDAPASVTADAGSLGAVPGDAAQIVSTASTSGIPSVALAAYQRAESVINAADTTCAMPWQLVAAIGRVESNHGRANGNVLGDDGLAVPGIFGVPLDGVGVALINDTDGGQYDGDAILDRAVGPMQFIPSTWAVVGVDADGDGRRDPQDINDAALAAAVYLIYRDDALSTPAGQQAAVLRYNHSQSYVDLVLSVMAAYLSGDFTTVPNSTAAAGIILADPAPGSGSLGDGADSTTGTKGSGPKTGAKPTSPTIPLPPTGGRDDGRDDGVGAPVVPSGPTTPVVPTVPTSPPTAVSPTLPTTDVAPVDQVLTVAQATNQCTRDGFDQSTESARFAQCVSDYSS